MPLKGLTLKYLLLTACLCVGPIAVAYAAEPERTVTMDMARMTPEQLEAFARTNFKWMDADGDGFIVTSEAPVHRKGGRDVSEAARMAERQAWIARDDADHDNRVSLDEFIQGLKKAGTVHR